ncbi:unnamed protein product [Prunus armeniaca]
MGTVGVNLLRYVWLVLGAGTTSCLEGAGIAFAPSYRSSADWESASSGMIELFECSAYAAD